MERLTRSPFNPDWGLASCAFCGESKELQLSHIVPRLVLGWIKRTSPTGHVRGSQEPNRRIQDSSKIKLLCRDCEQRFSAFETAFSNEVFRPIHDSAVSTAAYGPQFALFAASLCWRVLKMYSLLDEHGGFPAPMRPHAQKALERWHKFILGTAANPGRFELHALRLDLIESTNLPGVPANFNRYLYRTLDVDLPSNVQSSFVYAKLCRVLIMGHIAMPGPRQWYGTRISPSGGIFGAGDVRLPGLLANFMMSRAKKLQTLHARISERQRERMDSDMLRDIDRVANSEVFTAMQQDVSMFGPDAFVYEESNPQENA